MKHLKKVGFDNFNPLVHYIEYGKKEKRKTQHSKLYFDITSQDLIKNSDLLLNRILLFEDKFKKQSDELDDVNELLNLLFSNFNIEAKGILRLEQLLSLELLNLFDKFCKKNRINYWVDYGTLLGAIRQGGFIPWDDDIDVGMLRKDFEIFIERFMDEISKNNYLKENVVLEYHGLDENWKFNPNFLLLFAQIIFKKPQAKVDIFILDNVERVDNFKNEYKKLKKQFINDVINERGSISDSLNKYNSLLKTTENDANYIVDALDSYPSYRIFKHNDIFPIKQIKFENFIFNCPNNPHNCLIEYYGNDYMHIPKSIAYHNRVNFIMKQFESEKDAEISLKKAILNLKKKKKKLYG